MNNKPLSRNTNIVVQDLEQEVLVYDLKINKVFCLNETAGLVYQLSDGTKTVAEISNEMSVKLKTLVSEDMVWLAIEKLQKDNLLENAQELSNHFNGLSRREVVKRVGLASMVALPLISSVVAPTSLAAQSDVVNNCSFPRCIPAGANYCVGCVGRRLSLASFSSTDGTCTMSTGFSPIPWTCLGSPIETAPTNDLLIDNVT